MANSCKIDNIWRSVNKFFKKENGSWTKISSSSIESYVTGKSLEYGGNFGPDVVEEEYNPSGSHAANTNVIYTQTEGKPHVKTDENGKVTEYTFTETGVTTNDVDTGVIAFDSTNPGFHIHLVAEFVPSASTETLAIVAVNEGNSSHGLTVYSSGNYCYYKLKTQAYDTNGSKYKAWSNFSPTGKDTNYYKNRSVNTFDLVFTADKKFTLTINGKETDFADYSFTANFDNLSIKIGNGIPNFTINELTVTKNNE